MDGHAEPTTITTARLIMRPLELSDTHAVSSMLNDPENLKHTSYIPPKTLADTTKWLEEILRRPESFYFGVCLLAQANVSSTSPIPIIGLCGGPRTPEFSYIIDHRHAGRGYATEALAAVTSAYWSIRYPPSAKNVSQTELIAFIDVDNKASKRVVDKVGFEYVRNEQETREDGKVFDVEVWHMKPPSSMKDASAEKIDAEVA